MGNLKLILLFIFALFLGCSRTTPANQKLKTNEKNISNSIPLGLVEKTDTTKFDLDAVPQKFIVIVFASDTCSTCVREVAYWVDVFKAGVVKNIYFLHFLIGGNVDDARDWKDLYHVNWDVAVESSDFLYKNYCPAIRTPCFLIVNKETQQAIQTYEILKKENIEEITGLWEY